MYQRMRVCCLRAENERTGIGISENTGYLPRKLACALKKLRPQLGCADEEKQID